MKISRSKKLQKTLSFFTAHFNYHEPYQVLIDATFCQAALENKFIIEEQLKRYFQSPVKLVTTQCVILEAESLGAPLAGATMIVKKFYVHKCGHEGKPVPASQCIKLMTKDSRYIVASQDRALQENLRKVPGRCLLYLHKTTPVLEPPSKASKKYVFKKSQNLLPKIVEKQISHLKKSEGLQPNNTSDSHKNHKRPKNPNPLSCKKSKKNKVQVAEHKNVSLSEMSKTAMKAKPRRKRIKIPNHVKAAVQNDAI